MTTSGTDELATLRRLVLRAAPRLRRPLPWVGSSDGWAVLVSEIMLQQTPAPRVIGPWERFVARYPTPAALADRPLADVLREWRGLGYPRRARDLQAAARRIVEHHGGQVPSDPAVLRTLPGVGPYTAAAVASFAFGRPVAVIDTNVGRILARAVAGRPLRPVEARDLAERFLARRAPARFNQALLDLGAQHCRSVPRCDGCPLASRCRWLGDGGPDPAARSAGVSRAQSPYRGSQRELRGRILEVLGAGSLSLAQLIASISAPDAERVGSAVNGLVHDGLIEWRDGGLALRGETR